MKILFYRYGSICEPACIRAFTKMGLTVLECTTEIKQKHLSPSHMVDEVTKILEKESPLFVFSINYFPILSSICNIFGIPYVCWTVDSPVLELFSETLSNSCNRVFLFDKAQYDYFSRRAPGRCFYLPLATDLSLWEKPIHSASVATLSKFRAEVSFIGSLYSEKDPLSKVTGASDYASGFLTGLMEAQLKVYGYNFLEKSLPDSIIEEYKKIIPDMTREDYHPDPRYVLAHTFLGYHIAVLERTRLLNLLAKDFSVSLYTRSDPSPLKGVLVKGGAKTLTEMPLIFHESKINLNPTIRPIQTGLPQRIYDICGCGGFLLTNYQEELPLYYEIGKEVIAYTSLEECRDLCDYYLRHDTEREQIKKAGFERTKADHTIENRMTDMIRTLNQTI